MKYTFLKKYFENYSEVLISIETLTQCLFLTEYELLLEDELAMETLTHGLLNLAVTPVDLSGRYASVIHVLVL
jgi:hypothetical protein